MHTSILPEIASSRPFDLSETIHRVLASSGFDLLTCPRDPDAGERWMETALMTAFRDSGREDVFEALYRRARVSMTRWISNLLTTRRQIGDPLEILQDTFVNIFRYARGFRSEEGCSFRGWARTIAANVVRRSRMRRELVSLSTLPNGVAEPMDLRAGPQQVCQSSEQERNLSKAWTLLLMHYAEAFAGLSERDQRALELIEVEGLSYVEAGAILKVGRSNMKMIMFRARKRLRALMSRAMPENEVVDVDRGLIEMRAVG